MALNWDIRRESKTVDIGGVEVGRKPLVCASIAAAEPRKMVDQVQETEADLAELRIDTLNNPMDPDLKRRLSVTDRDKPVILTVRREAEEGEFRGSEKDRVDTVCSLMEQVEAVDFELEAPIKGRNRVLQKAEEINKPVIISFHDHSETSSKQELLSVIEQALGAGDIAKIAVTPHNLKDVLVLLETVYEAKKTFKKPLTGIAMGDIGTHTRIIAPLYGSDITYAAQNQTLAPGQLSVQKTLQALKLLQLR